jgi:acyl-coenzyme A synthetase/AMP-(fatty) acid ligase
LPSSTAVFNYYGPTEVAIWATRREVLRDEVVRRLASIGRPLPNVVCSIVSADDVRSQHLSPIGVWGELWLGGVQVARGYLKRQERTAESFVAFPWPATDPSGRGVVYRTGDRVRWYADGEVEFGGRIDFQVKLRGQRIELGEIEHALSSQPGVVEAIALLCTDLEEVSAEGQTRTHALMLTRHSAGLRFSPPPGGAGSLCLSSVRGRFAVERRIAIQPRAIAQWRT